MYILKAELRLWLKIHSPAQQSAYLVGIKPVHADGRESKAVLRYMELSNPASDQYIMLEVNELVRDFVAQGEY